MQLYLPIAEIPVNIFLILALGLFTGFLAGMFGIGGGFLSTPLLIFNGIPPAVAVSTSANQIMASSVSGVLAHLRRGKVDIKMGLVLLFGGFFGSTLGVGIFRLLQKTGQIDIAVALFYVIFLGSIGVMMLIESGKIILERKYNIIWQNKKADSRMIFLLRKIHKLPYKTRFEKSDIEVSVIVPIVIGFAVGILVAIMGIGGGFIMIPAMVYILRMPSSIVVGTSLFQIIFIAGNATFLQSITSHNVDIVLAFVMIISSVIGAQMGTKVAYKVDTESLRSILALMILGVCFKMFLSLFAHPVSLFTVEVLK
ncbi:MAG: sulfite exporter TauE/SafE family protein [Pseudomonadota bacterium]